MSKLLMVDPDPKYRPGDVLLAELYHPRWYTSDGLSRDSVTGMMMGTVKSGIFDPIKKEWLYYFVDHTEGQMAIREEKVIKKLEPKN